MIRKCLSTPEICPFRKFAELVAEFLCNRANKWVIKFDWVVKDSNLIA